MMGSPMRGEGVGKDKLSNWIYGDAKKYVTYYWEVGGDWTKPKVIHEGGGWISPEMAAIIGVADGKSCFIHPVTGWDGDCRRCDRERKAKVVQSRVDLRHNRGNG